MFRNAGVLVFDADATVHELYKPGGDAVHLINDVFPGVVGEDGGMALCIRMTLQGHVLCVHLCICVCVCVCINILQSHQVLFWTRTGIDRVALAAYVVGDQVVQHDNLP